MTATLTLALVLGAAVGGAGGLRFGALPSVASLLVDDAQWLAPPGMAWAPDLARGAVVVGVADPLSPTASARPSTRSPPPTDGTSGVVWVDEVLEGRAVTVIDDTSLGHEVHTVLRVFADGRSVEVDASLVPQPGQRPLQGQVVKWALQRMDPKGKWGLLTRSSPVEGAPGNARCDPPAVQWARVCAVVASRGACGWWCVA
jgi:hypothetical protein